MSEKVDLLAQYIGQVLIPRLTQADILFSNGQYKRAIITQKSIIRALYRRMGEEDDSDEERQLKDWIDKIDKIIDDPRDVGGAKSTSRQYREDTAISRDAKILYEKLDWEIWGRLHQLGYFAGKKGYGPPIGKYDPDKGVQI